MASRHFDGNIIVFFPKKSTDSAVLFGKPGIVRHRWAILSASHRTLASPWGEVPSAHTGRRGVNCTAKSPLSLAYARQLPPKGGAKSLCKASSPTTTPFQSSPQAIPHLLSIIYYLLSLIYLSSVPYAQASDFHCALASPFGRGGTASSRDGEGLHLVSPLSLASLASSPQGEP